MKKLGNPLTFRPDDELLAAMTHVREREGRGYSEQIREALFDYLRSKGVLDGSPARPAYRRPGRLPRIHRGHVVTYLTDDGIATGLVTDDRHEDVRRIIQLDPPTGAVKALHVSVIQRRYFTARQLAEWMGNMPASVVGQEMVEAMAAVRKRADIDAQERLDATAALWFGPAWVRIDYEPGMAPFTNESVGPGQQAT
jgi:hypothetical protein